MFFADINRSHSSTHYHTQIFSKLEVELRLACYFSTALCICQTKAFVQTVMHKSLPNSSYTTLNRTTFHWSRFKQLKDMSKFKPVKSLQRCKTNCRKANLLADWRDNTTSRPTQIPPSTPLSEVFVICWRASFRSE